MNSIEEKLWDYIDGTCTADERAAIDALLTHDEAYQQKYLELLALNREIAAMELDEPSMAFTYNVMETIRADYAKQPLKARINKTLINVIGGFFIVTIVGLFIIMLANINWSAGSPVSSTAAPFKMPGFTKLFTGDVFKGFMFFDVVLGLFLFDSLLRKSTPAKQT
ncbi:MAG: hypothetical protein JWQ34_2 [Mucilaginibacter sp.]|uniref:anti-sigma factor family protein n=1 Tax=Mucilaginibacter sp. TaxID=1882438 RepID=UPI0026307661|nr:zf-HC2 domain-containing protein [Mucilaginibacter sp.]MDB5001777.1 hypothetical protein [Mucilaginibacter sp.]